MSHDQWLDNVHAARSDPSKLETVLTQELPSDGLQHAGSAVLKAGYDPQLEVVVSRLIEALHNRGWAGDEELAIALGDVASGSPGQLIPLRVDLSFLIDALDESEASCSFLDLETGMVWPADVIDIDQGPTDFDADDETRWLAVTGLGSRAAWRLMESFAASVDDQRLKEQLEQAISSPGAFRRFMTTLERQADQFTRWHRYRNDAGLGQARHWLAQHGYQPTEH